MDIIFDNKITVMSKTQNSVDLIYKNYLLPNEFLKYCTQDTIAIIDEIQSSISPSTIPSFMDIIFDNNMIDIDII